MVKSTAQKVSFAALIFWAIIFYFLSIFIEPSPVKSLLMLIMLSLAGLAMAQVLMFKLRASVRVMVFVNVLLVTIIGLAFYFSIPELLRQ